MSEEDVMMIEIMYNSGVSNTSPSDDQVAANNTASGSSQDPTKTITDSNKDEEDDPMDPMKDDAGLQDPDEIDKVNARYDDDFVDKYLVSIGLPTPPFSTNEEAIAYIKLVTGIQASQLLHDSENEMPDLMAVRYEFTSYKDADKSETITGSDIINRGAWTQPIYPNPGTISRSTSTSEPAWISTAEGSVGITVYFQFAPNN